MAEYRVLWTDIAKADLYEIVTYIAADSVTSAVAVLDKIENRAHTLERFPERGRRVPELRAVDVLLYRELVEEPWRIVYRYDDKRVYVLAVLDARRDLEGVFLDRLSR